MGDNRTMTSCAALLFGLFVAMVTVHVQGGIHNAGKDPLEGIRDKHHGIKMGIPSAFCDDGKTFIEVDWDPKSMEEITCTEQENRTLSRWAPPAFLSKRTKPMAQHICFPDKIEYDTDLPVSGDHRPLWPKYGEYMYLPPQRWVHSLEHGAVVFLYHPCAQKPTYEDTYGQLMAMLQGRRVREQDNRSLIKEIREYLDTCLRKYIITPYRKIPHNMPYALVSFNNYVLFSDAIEGEDLLTYLQDIKSYALHAPEARVAANGQYDVKLLRNASDTIAPGSYQCG